MWLHCPAGPYASYEGSPVSKGVLQPDMWGVTPSDRWDWAGARQSIAQHGVRNSLLVAPMPTASTSQVGVCLSLCVYVHTKQVQAFHGILSCHFLRHSCTYASETQPVRSSLGPKSRRHVGSANCNPAGLHIA